MATAIRAIPTLYGETAQRFEQEAAATEQNPGTQDYSQEAELVVNYLKITTNVLQFYEKFGNYFDCIYCCFIVRFLQ